MTWSICISKTVIDIINREAGSATEHYQMQEGAATVWCRSSESRAAKCYVTDWRLWFKWMVDYIKQFFFDYLVHLLPCSAVQHKHFKNMHALSHCVFSITVVLWQKVKKANNHLTFQDKMDVILCENNLCYWQQNVRFVLANPVVINLSLTF